MSCLSAIGIASPFANYMHAGYGVDAGRWPKLAAFLKRVHTRPSFAACLEEERQALKAAAA